MSDRIANFSPLQSVYLSGMEAVVDVYHPDVTQSEIYARRRVLYSSMIQSGVDRLDLCGLAKPLDLEGPIANRIVSSSGSGSGHLNEYITILDAFFGRRTKRERKLDELKVFIAELLSALHMQRSLVLVTGIPDLLDFRDVLSFEEYSSIEPLMTSINRSFGSLPQVRFDVSLDALSRCEEVLTSELYRKYKEASETLDNSDLSDTESLLMVRDSADRLVKKNSRIVRSSATKIGLLTVSAKLIDIVFGGLSGKLADVAVDIGNQALSDNFRLTVYDLRSHAFNYLDFSDRKRDEMKFKEVGQWVESLE